MKPKFSKIDKIIDIQAKTTNKQTNKKHKGKSLRFNPR